MSNIALSTGAKDILLTTGGVSGIDLSNEVKDILLTTGDSRIVVLNRVAREIHLTTDKQSIIVSNSVVKAILSQRGSQGLPGLSGGESWNDYTVNKVQYTGVDTVIASGLVKECLNGAMTIYRFINSTNNIRGYPIEDAFYSDFDGTNLTNLIVTRGL